MSEQNSLHDTGEWPKVNADWPKGDFTLRPEPMASRVAADPRLKAAIKIEWPLVWRFLMAYLPTIVQIILALAAQNAKEDMAGGKLGVDAALDTLGIDSTGREMPESVKQAVAQEALARSKAMAKLKEVARRKFAERNRDLGWIDSDSDSGNIPGTDLQ